MSVPVSYRSSNTRNYVEWEIQSNVKLVWSKPQLTLWIGDHYYASRSWLPTEEQAQARVDEIARLIQQDKLFDVPGI